MQQSSSLSSKSYNSSISVMPDMDKRNVSPVNWISVISFLQNEYTKSSIREKQWFLQKKILNEEILKLKNELHTTQKLNINLNNRIKLLENALRRQKLMKNPNQSPKQQKSVEQARKIQQIEKYFQKNGWNLSQKPKNIDQSHHKHFLTKVMDQIGIKFSQIQQRCRKMSLNQTQPQQSRSNNEQKFQTLINELNKITISSKTRINAHLDSVRGIFATKNTQSQTLFVSVSEDCLVNLWNIDNSNKEKLETIEPISCFRQHTGQLFTIDGGNFTQGMNDLILFTAGTQQCVKVWYADDLKQRPQEMKCIGWFSNQKHENGQSSNELENQITWHVRYKNKRLLTSASDGIVRLFNVSISNQQNHRVYPEVKLSGQFSQKGHIQTCVEWVGESGFLTGCASAPRVNLWNIQKAKVVQKYSYEIDKIKDEKNTTKKQTNFSTFFQPNSLKYHSQQKLIFTGCEDNSIRIFSYDQQKIIKKLNTGINDSIGCVDVYKNNFIVAGCSDGTLKVWDRRTYRLLIDQQQHRIKYDEGILCLRTTDDGIFTGGADGVVNFYTI